MNHRTPLAALCLFSALRLAAPLSAQAPPASDIWLAELSRDGEAWHVGEPRNLTDRDGYDNQPAFSPDGRILYFTSFRSGQTDIWMIDLASGHRHAFAETAESEYSPTVVPGGAALSVVRVETDGTQRLWRFPFHGSDPTPLAPEVTGVGYHVWLDGDRVALFLLGEPITLEIVSLGSGERQHLADQPGRSLHAIPGSGRLGYVGRDGDGFALYAFDPQSGETNRLGPAPASEQRDHAWTPAGDLLAAVGNRLLRMRPGADTDWVAIADLAAFGVGEITRLAVSPAGDRIAFVADR